MARSVCLVDFSLLVVVLLAVVLLPVPGLAFSFSAYEQAEQEADQEQQRQRADEIAALLATPCAARLKGATTAFLFTQQQGDALYLRSSTQDEALYEHINSRLRRLGLKTFSPAQIRQRIADAEVQAFMNNDADAALAAARKFSARFVLRAQLQTQTRRNPVVGIDEVSVLLTFYLSDAGGRALSSVQVTETAFSDAQVEATLLTLTQRQADYAIARLYRDFCQQAR